ncbi:hypothetical protein ABB37_05589 [Leptomonas pyrrhocoris]|uniref:Protein phosphatase 1 regulatory subunit 7 n=1 Tax=Leptomonas pyrrhocoris TaxID=157538 RepID=A0A0M9FZH5_LEPPY|nr:hypothetical protein ABB37_05589 [Leptomonas pyrrhocoris]KPA79056.1 hypothetical protein ABB37_05589 [Leptomonas pyrrhocoris]|eukprot:XP_015657495.1 hypothetical protein ABB37_05589 [Leptomonas pyrrhocoris]
MSSHTTSLVGRSPDSSSPASGAPQPTPPPAPSSSFSPAHLEQLRQQLSSGLQSHPELHDLLGLCAESNDWTAEEARQRPDSIVTLELFLLQVHRLPLLAYFPNLVTIKLMNIGLESMADLAPLTHVEELWLSDNNIRAIEGLGKMAKLRRLFLQGNCITSMEGLPPLRHLRELWLARNQLQSLTHLTPLRKLRTLYVADNPIQYLTGAFSEDMTRLHEVNLSGCRIADVAQLCYLQQLPCLRSVWLADSLFGENPICRLSNYTTLALAMLDSLDSLDGTYVTAEQRSLVENILKKKKLYYEMRVQMLETHLVLLARHAESCAMRETAQNADALAQLHACLQPIDTELLERHLYRGSDRSVGSLFHGGCSTCSTNTDGQSPSSSTAAAAATPGVAVESAQLESLRLQLARAVGTCEIQEQKILLRLAHATTAASIEAQLLKERLAVELHTAGNVRLEPVKASHEFFTSVAELMQERFNRELFEQEFSITGVTVKGVRRIINRGLRLRFDNRVKELHADLANPRHRSRFVGLFGVVPASQADQCACLQHALLCGAAAADDGALAAASIASSLDGKSSAARCASYTPAPADEGVPLTDSLFYADEARLRALSCGLDGGVGGGGAEGRANAAGASASFSLSQVYSDNGGGVVCHGQLVLYRTYLYKAVSALGTASSGAASGNCSGQVSPSFVQKAGRVLRKDYGTGITAAYRVLPSGTAGYGNLEKPTDAPHTATPSYVWYCFDRELVLADCVVDYYYTVSAAAPTHASSASASFLASSFLSASGAAPTQLDYSAATALLCDVCFPCRVGVPSGNAGTNKEKDKDKDKDKGAAATADVSRDVRDDLLSCATPLLMFLHWCGGLPSEPRHNSGGNDNGNNTNNGSSVTSTGASNGHPRKHKARSMEVGNGGNTLKIVAVKETAEAIAAVTSVLGEALTSQLLGTTSRNTCHSGTKDDIMNALNNADAAPRPLQARDVENYAARMRAAAGGKGVLTLCVLRGLDLSAVLKDFTSPLLASVTTLDLSQNSLVEFSWFAVAKEAPQLQKLNLRRNRLASFHLDGSRLPDLRTLDLSDNLLVNVGDLRAIRAAAPALEELEVRGNPFMAAQHRQDAEAQLWLYIAPPTSFSLAVSSTVALVKLNQHPIGTYPGTLAVQRYRRACIVAGAPHASPRTVRVVTYLTQRAKEISGLAGSAAAAAFFSVDGVSVPERYVSAIVAQLEQWEAADALNESLAKTLPAPHAESTAAPTTTHLGDDAAAATTRCLNECRDLCWSYGLLDSVGGLTSLLPNLCRVVLRGHALTNIDPVLQLSRLESLNVAENQLTALPCFAGLKSLRELVVDFNNLTTLPAQIGPLPALRVLSAARNQISHVDPSIFLDGGSADTPGSGSGVAPTVPQLEVLHLSHNSIADMNVVYALREITSLLIFSVMGNPCTLPDATRAHRPKTDPKAAGDDTRQYLIHVFPQLKVLDGGPISATEGVKAREIYAGKISADLLIEKSHSQPDAWAAVRHLNLAHCTLTATNLLEPFVGLEVLQLQHNLISCVSGFTTLTRLKALDLSHNRLGAAAWRNMDHASTPATATTSSSPHPQATAHLALGEALAPLQLLESLSVESNQLTDFSVLKLRLPRLKFLNARGNDLQILQRGLEHLPDLRELLLDQNKLRALAPDCLAGNKKLSILSAENNALKTLEGLRGCARLEQLRLGANRLADLNGALGDTQACPLKALVLIGNPVARKSNYRLSIIAYFAQLVELDRRPITPEEREKAATARVAEYVAPPNVVIDMDFLAVAAAAAAGAGAPNGGVSLPMNVGVNGNVFPGVVAGVGSSGLPSRNRLLNSSAAIAAGTRRGGGAGGSGPDRFNVNPRSRPYRR